MGNKTLRELIRGILNEKGQLTPTKNASIDSLYYPDDKPIRKILIISPGINDAYEWKGARAAPHHFKQAVPRLDDDVAIVLAKEASTNINSVLSDIAKDETLSKVSNIELLGFSGGGNQVLHFMKSGGNAGKISKFYLADPYWDHKQPETATVPFPSKTTLMYNVINWDRTKNMGAVFKVMRKSIESGGGTVIETTLNHPDILRDMISKANS